MTEISFKKTFLYFICLVLSFLVIFASLLMPKTFYSKTDMIRVECGLPIAFTINDQSRYDPPFPWQTTCFGNPLEDIHQILWLELLVDLVVIFSLFLIVSRIFQIT